MQNGASRPGGRPLNCPHRAQPQPIIHRKRKQPDYYEEPELRGMELVKSMAVAVVWMLVMFFVWYYGGK